MKLFFYAAFLLLSALAQAQNLEFRFTNPECQAYGDKPKNSFCTRDDLAKAQANPNGPFAKVISLLKNPANKKITLATMSFSHKSIADALCEAVRRSVQVTVLVDAGVDLTTAAQVGDCGGQIFKVGTAEADDTRGDLHHNKFLLIERAQDTTLVFATANFSNPGLSINHETWGFVTDKSDADLFKNHHCLIRALKNYKDNRNQFNRDMNSCRERQSNNKVQSLFVPVDSAQLMQLIDQQMKSSSRVLMTSNRYSFDKITKAFKVTKNNDTRALFDDDLYWGGLQPTADYVNEALDSAKIVSLEKTGVKVKFMQTSFGAAQKMHDKFIVFDNMVIVGAGNYTYGGMTSNFENFYIIRDQATVEIFRKQFEYLWSIASYRNQMPQKYWDPGVRP